MLDWIPILFVIFKLSVFGTGMYFAIKWHYDQDKNGRKIDKRKVLRTAAIVVVVFLLALAALMTIIVFVSKKLGLELPFP